MSKVEKEDNVGVSVIIPVYNVEKYIERCLENICMVKNISIEIICVDDASTDSSLALIKKYAKKDKRIRIFGNKINKGQSHARNIGLSNARGKYIFFLDSDDWIEACSIEKMYFVSEENRLDVLFINMQIHYEDKKLKKIDVARYLQRTGTYDGVLNGIRLFELFHRYGESIIAVCLMFCNREYMKRNSISFYEGVIHEDFLFYPQVILQAERTMYLKDVFYNYCRRWNSTSLDMSVIQRVHRFKSFVILYCELHRFLWEKKCLRKNIAISNYLRMTYNSAINSYMNCSNVDDLAGIAFSEYSHELVYQGLLGVLEGRFSYNLLPHLNKIRSAGKLLVYGSGYISNEVIRWLIVHGIHDFHIVVSDGNPRKHFYGRYTEYISNYIKLKEECFVIVAANNISSKEMVINLKQKGFKNYILLTEMLNN